MDETSMSLLSNREHLDTLDKVTPIWTVRGQVQIDRKKKTGIQTDHPRDNTQLCVAKWK
jgi:hypothetical protein